ncbi:MAG: dTDP-4-dehydrorhamnose reductase [Burkholderiaceae bacterium]
MRILITGTTGQLGRELKRGLAVLGTPLCPDRQTLNLAKPDSLQAYLDAEEPELIVNPAAYTAVDKAETDLDDCTAVNADSPGVMARWCAQHDVAMLHFSTDYVYPGSGSRPFSETDATGPVNTYGRSKLAGEQAVLDSGAAALIFRTSWVYDAIGKNFLSTMLRLAETMPSLRVVDDQIGAPTHARALADACLVILGKTGTTADALMPVKGVYNMANSGEVSWHGFAVAIMQLRHQLTQTPSPSVEAITTEQFPTPAARPANSRLAMSKLNATFGIKMPTWQQSLEQAMADRISVS